MNIKINKTNVTVALLYNDGTSDIKVIGLVGKLSTAAAKKQIAEMQIANVTNFSVLKTEKEVQTFDIDDEAIYNFCLEYEADRLPDEGGQDNE